MRSSITLSNIFKIKKRGKLELFSISSVAKDNKKKRYRNTKNKREQKKSKRKEKKLN